MSRRSATAAEAASRAVPKDDDNDDGFTPVAAKPRKSKKEVAPKKETKVTF
jgi:hypothetical protein